MKEAKTIVEIHLIKHFRKMALDKRVSVKLEGQEKVEFIDAKMTGDEREIRSVAESFGLFLAMDLCKEITPYLRADIDRDEFSELFIAAVGPYLLLDFNEEWAKSVAAIANTEGLFPKAEQ